MPFEHFLNIHVKPFVAQCNCYVSLTLICLEWVSSEWVPRCIIVALWSYVLPNKFQNCVEAFGPPHVL